MKKRNFKKVVCGILTAVMLFSSMVCSEKNYSVVSAEETSVTGLNNYLDNYVMEVSVDDLGLSKTACFVYKGKETFAKEEADEIINELTIENNTEGILTFDLSRVKKSDGYLVKMFGSVQSNKVGSKGTFTVRYKDFEQTYTVVVVDPNTTVKEIRMNTFVIDPFEHPDKVNVVESDGTIGNTIYLDDTVFEYSMLYGFDIVNTNDTVMTLENGYFNPELISVEDLKGMQLYNPDTSITGGSFGSDGLEDIKNDTVCLFQVAVNKSYGGKPALKIKTVREGEAWFTLSYGGFSQRFHLIVENVNNYPSNITLDKDYVNVKPNESVTIKSTINPSNAEYIYSSWYVINDATGTSANHTITENGDSVTVSFSEEGVYSVFRVLGVSMDFSSGDFQSTVCKVHVSNDDIVITPTPEPTEVPTPTEIVNPTETATPDPTETVNPTETIQPTNTPTPLPPNMYYLGDVDIDGHVDAKDALLVLKYSAKMTSMDGLCLELGDVNKSNTINAKDALCILKMAAKLMDLEVVEK